MAPLPESVVTYARKKLLDLVSIPSVSAEGRGLEQAAQAVAEMLRELGLEASLHPTNGAPVVFAEGGGTGPTILFYNHYDVQPADPLEDWASDPFTLLEKDGNLYGRGTHDDKGELVARLAALLWVKQEHGQLPFWVKFVVEGEEETGSPNLPGYVESHRELLKSDAVLWEAGGTDAKGRPQAYCGLKGILAVELRTKTAGYDLHSSYGAVVQNPIYRLSLAIASLRDNQGKVLIKGFYDQVRALSKVEADALKTLPDESAELAKIFGVKGYMGGVQGESFYHKLLAEPCVNVNGFHSGYGGPGSKTVLPAEAYAKLDFRLVPDQEPAEVFRLLQEHLQQEGFEDIELSYLEAGEQPSRSDLSHPWVKTALEALREVYQKDPVLYINMAGSGPMHPFTDVLKAPVVGFGVGYPGTKVHSPNEHIRVADFEQGIVAIKRALEMFAARF